MPPQLSHSHSFGQFQFTSNTSPSALSPPMHHVPSSHQQPAQQMILQSHLFLGDCAPAQASSSLPSLATPAPLPHSALYPGFASVQQQGYLQQLPQLYASAAPVQLWMGDIEPWMDEEYIRIVWNSLGETVAVKIIRDRLTGAMANYCFIEVSTHADAERILALHNGKAMPSSPDRLFRLNWATGMAPGTGYPPLQSFATAGALESPGGLAASGNTYAATSGGLSLSASLDGPEFSLFVGDLAPEVTDVQLVHEFRSRYGSVRTAKVVTDPVTLLPRGYGFVRFADEADQQRALVEMQGHVIGSRTIRVSTATPKRTSTTSSFQQQYQQQLPADGGLARDATGSPALSESSSDSNALYNPATDPNNTTVFVGGLMHPVNEEELHSFFAVYGDVVYCKIPPNRGCGFVTFSKRGHAETAMRALNGHMLGGSRNGLLSRRSVSLGKSIAAAAPSASDLSPSATGHFSRQPSALAMRSSGQFEGLHPMQQNMYANQYDGRGDVAGNGLSSTMLPSLAACPSELLTRRLSALTLGSAAHLGSNELQSFGGGPSPSVISASTLASAPTLNRRPSAGVIGQRRLSSKSSFYQPPHKSSSQLAMAQMWPTTVEHSSSMPLTLNPGEFNASGTLSTPSSSARLSTSSLSFLAMTPSTLNHDHSGNDSGDSRRQSSDDKNKRDSQDQLNFAFDGNTFHMI
ncbi:hypothetical protein H4S03_007105 [Coemansia sp. S3946]|nr:hypothetical protein H4S03_007105 [Coemansia sp. S3946]